MIRLRRLATSCAACVFAVAAAARAQPAPEPKHPRTAVAISLGATVGGLAMTVLGGVLGDSNAIANRDANVVGHVVEGAGAAFAFAAPSLGHVYAGRTWSAGLAVRIVALAGAGACFLVVGHGEDNAGGAWCEIGGGAVFAVGAAIDIATAGRAACAYNRAHGLDAQLSVSAIRSVRGAVPSVGVVARF